MPPPTLSFTAGVTSLIGEVAVHCFTRRYSPAGAYTAWLLEYWVMAFSLFWCGPRSCTQLRIAAEQFTELLDMCRYNSFFKLHSRLQLCISAWWKYKDDEYSENGILHEEYRLCQIIVQSKDGFEVILEQHDSTLDRRHCRVFCKMQSSSRLFDLLCQLAETSCLLIFLQVDRLQCRSKETYCIFVAYIMIFEMDLG